MTLKDATGKCKVSLWREFAEKEVGIGQHLKITDVVVQTYNNEKSVSTTGRTEVETVEAPIQLKLTENIMADNMEENGLSLIIDDGEAYPAYRISLNKIATFLNCGENRSWKISVVVFLSSYIINL
uniref:Uncharacterized protein n=1 Tax=Magallana gigas TaxID=29159 RepID=A0A8W8M380_MAGGI